MLKRDYNTTRYTQTDCPFAPFSPPFDNFVDCLRYWSECTPAETAFRYTVDGTQGAGFSYAQLERHARIVAAKLLDMGATDEPVLLLYPPGLEFVTAFYGCLFAGAIAVPAYPPRRNRVDERIQTICRDSRARIALTVHRTAERSDEFGLDQVECVATDRLSVDFVRRGRLPAIGADTVAVLQYTSGSTGNPRGVVLTHGNLIHNCGAITVGFGTTRTGAGLTWLPTFHDMGLVGGVLEPVFMGRPNVLMSPMAFLQEPIRWLRGVSHFGVSISGGPNFAYDLCNDKIRDEDCHDLDLSSWEVAFNGAEPVRPETLDRFTERFAPYGFRAGAHYPCYGMAETTLIVAGGEKLIPPTMHTLDARALGENRVEAPVDGRAEIRVVSCGQPLPDMQVVIVDPQTRQPLPSARVGEIWVAGPSVARGYWHKPEQTRRTFAAKLKGREEQTYLRTGDLGFMYNGELYISGRRKDVIIIRGRNIYPQDIERTVDRCHEALKPGGGAVFSDSSRGPDGLVVAHEIKRQFRRRDLSPVIDSIKEALLEDHNVTAETVVLLSPGHVPKTSSGKVSRTLCRRKFRAGKLDVLYAWSRRTARDSQPLPHEPPPQDRSAITAESIQAWMQKQVGHQLGMSPAEVDIHKPLARFGLDSLGLVGIAGELQTWLDREVSPTLLYNYPTIAALAQHLSSASPPRLVDRTQEHTRVVGRGAGETDEPIAVVGLGCRFPGAEDPDAFWRLLREGGHAVGQITADRWDIDNYYHPDPDVAGKMYTRHAGLLEHIDQFDTKFFGIAPREAVGIDPQQRLLLEISWETLEHAGQAPDQLAGSRTGVFVGISNCEYERLQNRVLGLPGIDLHTGTGSLNSIAAGRIAYGLGLHGPCMVVDTACSSSLVAVHLAIKSLKSGECRAALAGGVNAIVDPTAMVAMCKLRALARDGRCKTFDESADGYVRGEGCGMVLLKKLSDAVADGNRILGLIRGTAVNHDGRSNGLTAPHGPSQEAVIRDAVAAAGVDPSWVTYLEAHGAATSLGDPIEVLAAAAVYGQGRSPASPLAIGSVKTNVGHLEAAAGMAGLLKVLLALSHGEIPRNLHLQNPNHHIPWDRLPITVPTETTRWPQVEGRRLAAVSAFGLSGTNAHVILEAPYELSAGESSPERPQHVLALSAKDESALRAMAGRYEQVLVEQSVSWPDLCFTANTGRASLSHRVAVTAASSEQAQQRLRAVAQGKTDDHVVVGTHDGQRPPRIAFVFEGEDALHFGIGRQLYESQPTFQNTVNLCAEMIDPHLDRPLLAGMYPEGHAPSVAPELHDGLPAQFVLQYALTDLWTRWGVQPNLVFGRGAGELAAACVAGVFSLEDALRLVAGVTRVREQERRGLSDELDDVLGQFDDLCQHIKYAAAKHPVLSSDAGRSVQDEISSAAYWQRHVRQLRHGAEQPRSQLVLDADIYLTVGPGGQLREAGQRAILDAGHVWLCSLAAGRDEWSEMLATLSQLFVRGTPVDWQGFDADYNRRKITAPTYPFQRQRYWVEAPAVSTAEAAALEQGTASPPALPPLPQWYYELQWHPRSRFTVPGPHVAAGLMPPDRVAQLVQPEVDRLWDQMRLPRYQDMPAEMDRLAAAYARQAVRKLGWRMKPGESVTVEGLAEKLGVAPGYHRLLSQMLNILAADGQLQVTSSGWSVSRRPTRRPAAELMWNSLSERLPECAAELTLLQRCGGQLAEVLTGNVDPLELLFPSGSGEMVERLYRDSPFARTLNTLVEEAMVQAMSHLLAGRVLKILEIGAGTGSTTTQILPRLPAHQTEYLFTDVSEVFTQAARAKFRAFPFVRYAALDIEVDPRQQGYADQQFDMILASNVFHATKDIRQTVHHTRQLLAPQGQLMLLEGTRPQYWMDLIFGLTEGWWRFTDTDLRPDHPMLSGRQWVELLNKHGFEQAVAMPAPEDRADLELPPYAVVLAEAAATDDAPTVVSPQPVATTETAPWLVLSDRSGVGQQVVETLRKRGDHCVLVTAGEHFKQVRDDEYVAGPTSRDDLGRVLKAVCGKQQTALRGVVHLWSLDAPSTEELTTEGLQSAQQWGCISATALLQELHAAALPQAPQTWFVTRGAQAIKPGSELSGLAQSPLWGLGRVVSEEIPTYWGGLLDLDPQAAEHVSAAQIVDELLHPDAEDQVAYRGAQRYAVRLVRRRPAALGEPLNWRPDASYLISGGLGDLGLTVARWMAEQGARNLVLFGRSEFPPRSEWENAAASDPRRAAQIAVLEELEAAGVMVRIAAADTADEQQLSALRQSMHDEGWPPIRGVVHCAGVAEATPLFELEKRQIEQVLRPKVAGTWLLHRLLEKERLDFFVNFSSGASLLGSPLLGHYAAANAFLDSIAHHRGSQGLPALSINWGFWSQTGMVARSQREIGWGFAPQGMQSYEPAQGLAAMQQLLEERAIQASVMPVDWQQWRGFHPRASRSPLLHNLMLTETESISESVGDTTGTIVTQAQLLAASESECRELLQDYLTGQLSRVLRTSADELDVELPLRYLGIDSLMAVELRNRIQVDLDLTIPVAQLLQEPTISRVANLLFDQLHGRTQPVVPVMSSTDSSKAAIKEEAAAIGATEVTAQEALARLDDLSDAEVSNLLNEMLQDKQMTRATADSQEGRHE